MNFTAVAFLDPFDLIASLPKRMGLFKAGEPRLLPIRGPRAGGDPEDDLGFVNYSAAARWPEVQSMLKRIKRIAPEQEFGHIFLDLLPANTTVPWLPAASGEYRERHVRGHLALRTNPGAVIVSGIEAMHLPVGVLTIINQRVPTTAINLGEGPRIHLVIDSRKKDQADDP